MSTGSTMWPSASNTHGWAASVTTETSTGADDVPGQAVGELAVDDDGLAVDDGGLHALAPRLEAAHPAGQVVDELLLPRADGVRVEDHDVGPPALLDGAPVGETEQGGGPLGDLADALLQGPPLAVAPPAPEEVRAPVGAVVAGQVGPAVGHAHHHPGVELGLAHRLGP